LYPCYSVVTLQHEVGCKSLKKTMPIRMLHNAQEESDLL